MEKLFTVGKSHRAAGERLGIIKGAQEQLYVGSIVATEELVDGHQTCFRIEHVVPVARDICVVSKGLMRKEHTTSPDRMLHGATDEGTASVKHHGTSRIREVGQVELVAYHRDLMKRKVQLSASTTQQGG